MTNAPLLLNRIKQTVLAADATARVYLYGSRVRGTAQQDSDWDLLILLAEHPVTNEREQTITNPLYDLEIETGEVISAMVYAETEWHAKYGVTPFYAAVTQEAVQL